MKTILLSTMLLLTTVRLFGQGNTLPGQWDKDFVVSIGHNNTMGGSSSRTRFTYDSCTYFSSTQEGGIVEKKFVLTQADRDTILTTLKELKVDRINAKKKYVAQHDGWSTTLSFGGHFIEGGSGVELTEKDRDRFQRAYQFLDNFMDNR